jgi:hypothetical protein
VSSLVEIRCPVNQSRLFMKVGRPTIVEGNLIQVACTDCRDTLRREGVEVSRVLHEFNVLGDLIETVIER